MTATTSTRFISVTATGENWRDVCKKALEELESLITEGFHPTIGFLYVTDPLSADAGSILNLFRSVTKITHWAGCAALGVCGTGAEYVAVPAISVLIGALPVEHFRCFHTHGPNHKKLHKDMEPWLNKHDAMLVVTHAAAVPDNHPAEAIEDIDSMIGGFMVGGFESARAAKAVFSHEVFEDGIAGVVFSQDVAVSAAISQGCRPMGPLHEISSADDHVIGFLDGRVPFTVFGEDMTAFAEQTLGYSPKEKILEGGNLSLDLLRLIEGQAHIAFPVPESDQNDYLVRNIMAIDPDSGMMAVSERIDDGQKLLFVHRNDESVKADLSHTLVTLRKRVEREQGVFTPKAALYISCVARTDVDFSGAGRSGGEMALVRDVLGDIPLAGFYANGEIFKNRVYGYTALVVLFL